jgi:heptosyltransferase III
MASTATTTRDRVLVIFSGALGDLICLLPTLGALARRYRGCSLELMARAELADFAVGRMGIARGHSIDRREVSLLFSLTDDAAEQAGEFFGAFSAIHCFFGSDDSRLRKVLTRACPGAVFFHPFRPEADSHISAAYLQAIGEPPGVGDFSARIELRADDLAAAERLLAERGASVGEFVLLMPGSGNPAKNWPADNYSKLAHRLARSTTVLIVLGPAEEALEASFSDLKTIMNPPLGALAGLARMASAFVGNDSGVSHLAAAVGGRGVVIFGPTDPARWRPLGTVTIIKRMPLRELPWKEVADALEAMTGCAESTP